MRKVLSDRNTTNEDSEQKRIGDENMKRDKLELAILEACLAGVTSAADVWGEHTADAAEPQADLVHRYDKSRSSNNNR
jgi:hypothetical protein